MVSGFAVPVQKFSNFILGNNNSGHHLADILFMFLKQIPQISYYYVRKSATANKGKESRQELISFIYSSRQKWCGTPTPYRWTRVFRPVQVLLYTALYMHISIELKVKQWI